MIEAFEDRMARGGSAALQRAASFFMHHDPVYAALTTITARLKHANIPHAVAGGMAVVAHGYSRTTDDVDILVTQEGLTALHQKLDGLGYLPLYAGSKNLRDAATGVRIEFLISGHFPGDGKPKPVAFPDPQDSAAFIDDIPYLSLPILIELKLASGMTNPGRLKDLSDVQEIIRRRALPRAFAQSLNPYVQPRFLELWQSVQASGEQEEP